MKEEATRDAKLLCVNPALLLDPKLVFVMLLAATVTLLGSLNIAARPAAVMTGRVALAFSVSSIFFMVSRLANLLYLPLLASFVDDAVRTGNVGPLQGKIMWVIVGASLGALASYVLLPNFVSLYCFGIDQVDQRKSMVRTLVWAAHPRSWVVVFKAFLARTPLQARLFHLDGVPAGFLLANVFATSVWTCGALSALLYSAQTKYGTTAVLLSGLVNAFAAIAFSVWVDPKAAHITDQAVSGERPQQDVSSTALHLAAGNVAGSLLGLAMLFPATALIGRATEAVGHEGASMAGTVGVVVLLNMLVTALASTTYAARVSAVVTRRVAMAMAIYNLFFLVTRLAQQVYAPILGSLKDNAAGSLVSLESLFRQILLGASGGAFLGLLLLPTFVEIYSRAIRALDVRGSLPAVLLAAAHPRRWPLIVGCLRWPTLFGLKLNEIRQLPLGFLIANPLVISIHTVGVMAAIYAGALPDTPTRTATLLSSVINGLATITLSVVIDPMCSLITDQAVKAERPARHIYIMAVMLMGGMLVGTLASQVIFTPAAYVIRFAAQMLDKAF